MHRLLLKAENIPCRFIIEIKELKFSLFQLDIDKKDIHPLLEIPEKKIDDGLLCTGKGISIIDNLSNTEACTTVLETILYINIIIYDYDKTKMRICILVNTVRNNLDIFEPSDARSKLGLKIPTDGTSIPLPKPIYTHN